MEVFASSFIDINSVVNKDIKFDFLQEDEDFGIFELKTNETPITTKETLFLFSVDVTGSMNEIAYGKNTKIDIVKQTFKNMIKYLAKLDAPISIRIHCFNTDVEVLLDTFSTKNTETMDEIYSLIEDISADGSTNIENALKEATTFLDNYKQDNPTHQICHIFMTDGYATSGITDNNALSYLVSDIHSAIFVGFGEDHNIQLMKKMTSKMNTVYQFVNDMEDTSMIYGESIHQYIYPAANDIDIVITDGLIYDWRTNKWTTTINELVLSSNSTKIYHIKKDLASDVTVNIYGVSYLSTTNEKVLLETISELPGLINFDTDTEFPVDLTKYMLRQKTQVMLFEAKSASNRLEIQTVRTKIRDLFDEIKKYMNTNNINSDSFMLQLCDDLCITYRNIGTEVGNMFVLSRYTSQGRQQTYSATPRYTSQGRQQTCPATPRSCSKIENSFDFDNNTIMRPTLERSSSCAIQQYPAMDEYEDNAGGFPVVENENDETSDFICGTSEMDTYVISGRSTSCYANDSTINTMTQISLSNPF